MRTELDHEDDDCWYEPPHEEVPRQRLAEIAQAACKTILDRLGPAPVVAGGGGAYREHLENPPSGPGDAACACPACTRFAELRATMPFEAAIAQALRGIGR